MREASPSHTLLEKKLLVSKAFKGKKQLQSSPFDDRLSTFKKTFTFYLLSDTLSAYYNEGNFGMELACLQ
ncbi:MAG: hypothetical protein ACSNEK_10120 [Parachlamydiaceae bacterium]